MNAPAHIEDHRPNVALYMGVFAALLCLTGLTVFVSKFHLPRPQAVALGLFIALIKAGLVAAVFMHLWGEKKLIHRALLVAFFFATGISIALIDGYLAIPRLLRRMPVAQQHPAETAAEAP